MKAMIFAAGLGTRLKPLTGTLPKALIEVGGVPMIERVILKLKSAGIAGIIINLHHFPYQIKEFIQQKNSFGLNIQFSDESEELLETGGGLKNASWFFDDGKPFLVHNVDVLSNVNLLKMINFHTKNKTLATLFVQERQSSRYLLMNDQNRMAGWKNEKTNEIRLCFPKEKKLKKMAFNGIHIIDPRIFNLFTEQGKFSIIDTYLRLATTEIITGFMDENALFVDIGKPESLHQAEILVNDPSFLY
jgi:NDP-sugar pyrophosphorylase family protein